ncbi:hypothetical protein RUND412_004744 [Rhizina undulata]
MCFYAEYTVAHCPYQHKIRAYNRLCTHRLASLSTACAPLRLRVGARPSSYASLAALLPTSPPLLTQFEHPAPPQELLVARAGFYPGCGSDVCVSSGWWQGLSACPACVRDEMLRGEYRWVILAAGIAVPTDDEFGET